MSQFSLFSFRLKGYTRRAVWLPPPEKGRCGRPPHRGGRQTAPEAATRRARSCSISWCSCWRDRRVAKLGDMAWIKHAVRRVLERRSNSVALQSVHGQNAMLHAGGCCIGIVHDVVVGDERGVRYERMTCVRCAGRVNDVRTVRGNPVGVLRWALEAPVFVWLWWL